ncbi:MAG TPA: hypothetical protein VGE77_05590 [Nocardioides sp.]
MNEDERPYGAEPFPRGPGSELSEHRTDRRVVVVLGVQVLLAVLAAPVALLLLVALPGCASDSCGDTAFGGIAMLVGGTVGGFVVALVLRLRDAARAQLFRDVAVVAVVGAAVAVLGLVRASSALF